MKKSQRKTIYHVNRRQRIFLYPVIAAFFLGCIIAWLSLLHVLIGRYIFEPELYRLQKAIPGMLATLTVVMIVVILWALHISRRHVEPHERIMKELDDILDGKKSGPLATRKDDALFKELLKRVNDLIDRK